MTNDEWEDKYGHLQPAPTDDRDRFFSLYRRKKLRLCHKCLRDRRHCNDSKRAVLNGQRCWKKYRRKQYK